MLLNENWGFQQLYLNENRLKGGKISLVTEPPDQGWFFPLTPEYVLYFNSISPEHKGITDINPKADVGVAGFELPNTFLIPSYFDEHSDEDVVKYIVTRQKENSKYIASQTNVTKFSETFYYQDIVKELEYMHIKTFC